MADKQIKKMEILDAFKNLFDNADENTIRFILKELFSRKNIKMVTDLDSQEIMNTGRAEWYKDFFTKKGDAEIGELLHLFYDEILTLRVSRARMSRVEYIEGFKTENRQIIDEKTSNQVRIR